MIKASEAIRRENAKVLSDALALRVDLPLDLRSCMAQLGVVMAHLKVAYAHFEGCDAETREKLKAQLLHPWKDI